jgi:hypothetical protein
LLDLEPEEPTPVRLLLRETGSVNVVSEPLQ